MRRGPPLFLTAPLAAGRPATPPGAQGLRPAAPAPAGARGPPPPPPRRGCLRGPRGDDQAAPGGAGVTAGVWSPSARFSLLALLATAVPATIVALLGYISIRQWEKSSELLYREQARDMAA